MQIAMHAPSSSIMFMKGGQGLGKALSLCLDLDTDLMASFDSSLSEADRMAQGACDGAGTTGHGGERIVSSSPK